MLDALHVSGDYCLYHRQESEGVIPPTMSNRNDTYQLSFENVMRSIYNEFNFNFNAIIETIFQQIPSRNNTVVWSSSPRRACGETSPSRPRLDNSKISPKESRPPKGPKGRKPGAIELKKRSRKKQSCAGSCSWIGKIMGLQGGRRKYKKDLLPASVPPSSKSSLA